jgi:hypothetical protein
LVQGGSRVLDIACCAEDVVVNHFGQASFSKLIQSGEDQRSWDGISDYSRRTTVFGITTDGLVLQVIGRRV